MYKRFFCFLIVSSVYMLLPEINLHRYPGEIPVVADVVFEEPAVRLLDVLRQVYEKRELRRGRRELGHVLDLDVFALVAGGG
mgnify:CR=1 FL=1